MVMLAAAWVDVEWIGVRRREEWERNGGCFLLFVSVKFAAACADVRLWFSEFLAKISCRRHHRFKSYTYISFQSYRLGTLALCAAL